MKDLHYSLDASESISESLVRLTLHPTNNNQAILSCHAVRISFLSELSPSSPKKGLGVSKPPLRPSNHGRLPFFVTNYLEKGPDDDYRHTCIIDGDTALHQAMRYFGYTRIRILKLLLEKGIDVNARDSLGNTALHLVVNSSGSLKESVVRLLLDYNTDINAQNQEGKTALHLAARRGNETIVKELLNKKVKIDIQESSGKTALHLATKYEYTEIVKMLLESRANVNAQDLKGLTALHIASKLEDHAAMTKLLLGYGADLGIQDIYGRTVLHIVIRTNDQARVKLLVENGASFEIPDRDGNTARSLDIHYHLETALRGQIT